MKAILALTALLIAVAPAAVAAKSPAKPAVAAPDRALIGRATAYLSGLRSAQAKFSQTDTRGAVSTGTFSLQRPGKARFAYDPPADLTVVADGTNVNISDAKLKTFDQYPLKQTPLAILLADRVKLSDAAAAASVTRGGGGFTVTVVDPKNRAQGSLALDFTSAPVALTGWTVTDPQGQRTTVKLSGLKAGVALAPSLFVLNDPRPHTFKP